MENDLLNIDLFEKTILRITRKLNNYILQSKYEECLNYSKKVLQILINIYKKRIWGTECLMYEGVIFFAITIKLIQDYTELIKLVLKYNYKFDNKLIEKIWIKLIDLEDRLAFISKKMEIEAFKKIHKLIDDLETYFQKNLGNGLYFSPEIKLKNTICSICELDYRACNHIAGNVYNGILCNYIPQDPELKAVSIVENPKDRRCRAWPWNQNKKNHLKAMIMTTHSLHDFLHEEE